MKNRLKGLLSFWLALTMLVGMAVVPAYATENTSYRAFLYTGEEEITEEDDFDEIFKEDQAFGLDPEKKLNKQDGLEDVPAVTEDGQLLTKWKLWYKEASYDYSQDSYVEHLDYNFYSYDAETSDAVYGYISDYIIEPVYEMPHLLLWIGEEKPIAGDISDNYNNNYDSYSEFITSNIAGIDILASEWTRNYTYTIPLELGGKLNQNDALMEETAKLADGKTVIGWEVWGYDTEYGDIIKASKINAVSQILNDESDSDQASDGLFEDEVAANFDGMDEDYVREFTRNYFDTYHILLVPVFSDKAMYQINPQPTAEYPTVGAQEMDKDGEWGDPTVDVEYQWYSYENFVVGDKAAEAADDVPTMLPGMLVADGVDFDEEFGWTMTSDTGIFAFPVNVPAEDTEDTEETFCEDSLKAGDIVTITANVPAGAIVFMFPASVRDMTDEQMSEFLQDFFMNPSNGGIASVMTSEEEGEETEESSHTAEFTMPYDGYVFMLMGAIPEEPAPEMRALARTADDGSEQPFSFMITVDRYTAIEGETSATLSRENAVDGMEYFCEVTFDPEGKTRTVLESESFVYDSEARKDDAETTVDEPTFDYGWWQMSVRAMMMSSYNITASADEGGAISPAGATKVRFNMNQTYTITPAAGMVITDVLVDGVSVGAVSEYTFKHVTEPHTIHAVFGAAE